VLIRHLFSGARPSTAQTRFAVALPAKVTGGVVSALWPGVALPVRAAALAARIAAPLRRSCPCAG
jgi:hypothetical protein